jgi:hypothetical protein
MTQVDPAVLVAALVAEGWTVVGHRSGDGGYQRLKRDSDDRHEMSLVVPNVAGYEAADDEIAGNLTMLRRQVEDGARAARVLGRLGIAEVK